MAERSSEHRLRIGIGIRPSPTLEGVAIELARGFPNLEGFEGTERFQLHVGGRIWVGVNLHAAALVRVGGVRLALDLDQAHVVLAGPEESSGIGTNFETLGGIPGHSQQIPLDLKSVSGRRALEIVAFMVLGILWNPEVDPFGIPELTDHPHADLDGGTLDLFVRGGDLENWFKGTQRDSSRRADAVCGVNRGGEDQALADDFGVAWGGIECRGGRPVPCALRGRPGLVATEAPGSAPRIVGQRFAQQEGVFPKNGVLTNEPKLHDAADGGDDDDLGGRVAERVRIGPTCVVDGSDGDRCSQGAGAGAADQGETGQHDWGNEAMNHAPGYISGARSPVNAGDAPHPPASLRGMAQQVQPMVPAINNPAAFGQDIHAQESRDVLFGPFSESPGIHFRGMKRQLRE